MVQLWACHCWEQDLGVVVLLLLGAWGWTGRKSGVLSCVGWGDMGHIHCSLPPTHAPSLGRNWLHYLHLFLSRANRKGERVKV